jgi:hypothetical protein
MQIQIQISPCGSPQVQPPTQDQPLLLRRMLPLPLLPLPLLLGWQQGLAWRQQQL